MRPRATRHDVEVEDEAGYLELLRANANVRRLWLGTIVSLFGDWFNTIAIYALVSDLTGSAFALGAVFIAKMLPWALASPVAGLLVDRFDRRWVMILSDLGRAVIVLGFLFVDAATEVWLIYALTALQVVVGSVFQPARSASVPNITSPRELLTANALMAATWSVLLALGAAAGGFVTAALGPRVVFAIDSASYLVSAFFIFRMTIPHAREAEAPGPILPAAYRKIVEGWRHLRAEPRVGRIATAKATWALGGGACVYLLTLLGGEMTPADEALGIGLLFSARGLGTGIGPIMARALFRDADVWPRVLGASIVISGASYLALGFVPWTWFVLGLVVFAHAASGANWVLATVLLQKRTEDRLRGRVFATEWLLLMLADAASIFVASTLLEAEVLTLRGAFTAFAALQVASGLVWTALVVPRERTAASRP